MSNCFHLLVTLVVGSDTLFREYPVASVPPFRETSTSNIFLDKGNSVFGPGRKAKERLTTTVVADRLATERKFDADRVSAFDAGWNAKGKCSELIVGRRFCDAASSIL